MTHVRRFEIHRLPLLAFSLALACGGGDDGGGSDGSTGSESGDSTSTSSASTTATTSTSSTSMTSADESTSAGTDNPDGSGSATEGSATDEAGTTEASESGGATGDSSGGESTGAGACADSCDGCCLGESCLAGDMTLACGQGGAACLQCEGFETCESNACALDVNAQWNLVVVSATLNDWGLDSGGPGSCYTSVIDPFVVAVIDMMPGETSVLEETTMPVWNEKVFSATVATMLAEPIYLYVWDDDGQGMCSEDDALDNCAHQITEAEIEAGGFTLDFCGTQIEDFVFELAPA
jgi:hypothetical protein